MAILTSVNGGIAGVDALLGGWLAGNFGFRSVFWVMCGVAVLAVVLVWSFARESTADETPKDGLARRNTPFRRIPGRVPRHQRDREARWVPIGGSSPSRSLSRPSCS